MTDPLNAAAPVPPTHIRADYDVHEAMTKLTQAIAEFGASASSLPKGTPDAR